MPRAITAKGEDMRRFCQRLCAAAFLIALVTLAFALAPSTARAENMPSVWYRSHVQRIGWQGQVIGGTTSGTTGRALRLEALQISLSTNEDLGIAYSSHVQRIGWQGEVTGGKTSGTTGKAWRLEAIRIRLTGSAACNYHVQYRVHAQTYGWLGWAEDGEIAGSCGYAKRLEAVEIRIVRARDGSVAGGVTGTASHVRDALSGEAHIQSLGWNGTRSAEVGDSLTLGTTGRALRMEAVKLQVSPNLGQGGIAYNAHVQTYGWQGNMENSATWVSNGAVSGTTGRAKRIEGIQLQLTGSLAQKYEIWYRCCIQTYGWLGWTHDGRVAGSFGLAKRLEAIEMKLVPKGGSRPKQTSVACMGITSDGAYAQATAANGTSMRFNLANDILYLPSWASSVTFPSHMRASASASDIEATNTISVAGGKSTVWLSMSKALPPTPITIMRSASIPSVSLSSADATQDRAWIESSADHSNKAKGSMTMVWPDGSVSYSGGLSQIKGRGNYTWTLSKRPYQIKLSSAADLLCTGDGANAAKTWVLLACYGDPALMRDMISFGMARSMGQSQTPESCFVDLWYDNEYRGTYQLCEKVQIGSGRVDIDEDSGSFLVELDAAYYTDESTWFNTSVGPFVMKDSDDASEPQLSDASEMFQKLIDAGSDPALFDVNERTDSTSLTPEDPVMDLDSAVVQWLINTLAKNRDFNYSSTFFYYDAACNTVFSGPLWDHNAAYGDHPKAVAQSVTGMEYSSDSWYYDNPLFRKRVREVFNDTFKPLVNGTVLGSGDAVQGTCSISGLVSLLCGSQSLNQSLWGVTANGSYGLIGNTWESNVDGLRSWIASRLAYMDSIINSSSWYDDSILTASADAEAEQIEDEATSKDKAQLDEGQLNGEETESETDEALDDSAGDSSSGEDSAQDAIAST